MKTKKHTRMLALTILLSIIAVTLTGCQPWYFVQTALNEHGIPGDDYESIYCGGLSTNFYAIYKNSDAVDDEINNKSEDGTYDSGVVVIAQSEYDYITDCYYYDAVDIYYDTENNCYKINKIDTSKVKVCHVKRLFLGINEYYVMCTKNGRWIVDVQRLKEQLPEELRKLFMIVTGI